MSTKFLIIPFLLIYSSSLVAQSTSTYTQRIEHDVAYLKQLSSVAVEWTAKPEKKELRKEMQTLMSSFDSVKQSISFVLILKGSENDKKNLIEILKTHQADQQKLIEQLLLWKYEPEPIEGIEILTQLDEIHKASTQILSNFQKDKSLDNVMMVLLSQDAAENIIAPLSKSVIEKLKGLK